MNWSEYEDEDEKLAERHFWRKIGFIIFATFALAVILSPLMAQADEVRTPDGQYGYIRHEAKCDDADILKHLAGMGAGSRLDEFKNGTLTYEGKNWRSCWIEVDGTVYSVDSEGAPFQPLPVSIFKKTGLGA